MSKKYYPFTSGRPEFLVGHNPTKDDDMDCDYNCSECMSKGAMFPTCCRAHCGLFEYCKYCSLMEYYLNLKS